MNFKTNIEKVNYALLIKDRAIPKASEIIKKTVLNQKVELASKNQKKLKDQRDKIKHVKNLIKKELKREELQTQNIKLLRERVKDIEQNNLKKRRDLNTFMWKFKEGKADAILGLIEQEYEKKGRFDNL